MTEQQIENHSGSAEQTEKPGWEREVMEKLVFAAVTEQRRTRRWGIFFKSLMFVYLFVILVIAVYPRFKSGMEGTGDGHTAVINIVGIIAEGEEANAESIIKGLRNAVKDKGTKGIILHINTPGGSPVQSADVYEEIMRTRKENPDIKIYAVVSDICASGGYYIASAADKIYVNQASIVGSIGVIMNGFGFVDTLKKFGIERRLLTSGTHKALMDPFSPINKSETEHMQSLLNQVHQQFIDAVRQGRGDRLKESPEIFSGLVWTGTQSVKLGLADDFGNDDFVAREVVGVEKRVDFTLQERLLDRLTGKLGASFGRGFSSFIQGMTLR